MQRASAKAGYCAYHPRAARPTRATCQASLATAELRCERLWSAQRGRAVRKSPQTLAGDIYPSHEKGFRLSDNGYAARVDHLVAIMNPHKDPSLLGKRI